ncbi:MAG: aldo/keto reductase [Cyanobacteria bacterium J06597_1]
MGCGTWAWGNRLLWGYSPDIDGELQQVFNLCVGCGVTLFDTGDSYGTGRLNGRSEQLLGQFAAGYGGVNGDRICIATKLAAYPWRLTRGSMLKACDGSVRRLQRPVDLAQMHWSPSNYAPWQEQPLLNGLGDLCDRGLVKGVGLSNYGPKMLRRAHRLLSDRGIPIVSLQVQYSLLSRYPETELDIKSVCNELGIRLIAYSPLALGLLTGKYSVNGMLPAGLRGLVFRQILPGIQPLLNCLQEVAAERNKSMAQVAINWCMTKGAIPIPGAKSVEQAQANVGALGWQLTTAEVEALEKAAAKSPKQMVQNIFQTK